MGRDDQGKAPRAETEDRGGSQPHLSPDDDQSIVKNKNNPAYDADVANRKEQAKRGK